MNISPLERFLDKVKESQNKSHNETPCLEWQAGKSKSGYGKFKYCGQTVRAHRFVWAYCIGPIPDRMCVCHHCDNTLCVNVCHLYLGTNADNSRDMQNKGRAAKGKHNGSWTHEESRPRGERHGMSKLTDSQVSEIRRLYIPRSQEFGCPSLCSKFNVHPTQIWNIVRGQQR